VDVPGAAAEPRPQMTEPAPGETTAE
jgi:hypothetical protein